MMASPSSLGDPVQDRGDPGKVGLVDGGHRMLLCGRLAGSGDGCRLGAGARQRDDGVHEAFAFAGAEDAGIGLVAALRERVGVGM